MTRWRTRSRRCASAAAVEVALASNDWQMPKTLHAVRAPALPLPTSQSRLTSGMLTSRTFALGRPALSFPNVLSIDARYADTDVIVDSELVHASLAPMRMVTYTAPCDTATSACPGISAAFAPVRASLKFL